MLTRAIDPASVDRLLMGAVQRSVAPGVIGAVANSNGVLYERAFGRCSADLPDPMTIDTVVWIASMTKLVTTVAAMQLVETGDLVLDAPVADLLPELAHPSVLNEDGTTRPAQGLITLRHLLTHTSGIGYELMNPALLQARGISGPPPATSRASLEGPLAHEPGSGWTYGYGIDWVGIAIERWSGQSLDHYLATRILTPLEMNNTGFLPLAPERLAATHLRGARGGISVIPSPAGSPADREFHPGGAGLFSTVGDYIRLLRMLLGRGELEGVRVLRSETVDTMWDNQVCALAAGRLDTTNRALVLPYDPLPGQHGEWSLLGLRNAAAVTSGRSCGSASWVGVAGTFFWVDREADLCGVLAAQIFPFADPLLIELQGNFERSAYACFSTNANV